MSHSDTLWTATISRPDDIDAEITLEDRGGWRWTVWCIRLIRSGSARTLDEAKAGAAQDLIEMAERYRADISEAVYHTIHDKTYRWSR